MIDYDSVISRRVQDIKPSGIRKFFDILENMHDAISLGVGEPDFQTPWHIRDAGIYSLEKGFTKYTSNAGMTDVRREISNYLSRRFDLHYDMNSQILVTVGGSEAIDLAIRCITNPGDEILIPEPSFVCYGPIASLASGVPVPPFCIRCSACPITVKELRPVFKAQFVGKDSRLFFRCHFTPFQGLLTRYSRGVMPVHFLNCR